MKFLLIMIFFCSTIFNVNAQTYTLKTCIETALSNNLRIKVQNTTVQLNEVALQDTKDIKLPILQGNMGQGINFGRSIDPYSNSYANQNIVFNNLGINASYTLYDGGKAQNQINEKKKLLEAAKQGALSEKQQLTIQVILAYTQLVATQEMLNQSLAQATITNEQLIKTKRLIEMEVVAGSSILDLKTQHANDEYNIVNIKGQLAEAKLQLSQLMAVPSDSLSSVEPINEPIDTYTNNALLAEETYRNALNTQSGIKQIAAKIAAKTFGISVVQAAKYPTITLTGGIGSNYSSVAKKAVYGTEPTETNTGAYVVNGGTQLPVMISSYSTKSENISYFNQITQNRNSGLGIQIKIPIANGQQIRHKTLLATYERDLLQTEYKQTQQQLRQYIDQAVSQLQIAQSKYIALSNNYSTAKTAFESAKIKLNSGTINAIEYTQVKSIYDKASLQLIQSKYEWIMRKKIVDYYGGNQYSYSE